jgi:hypothetical protein
VAFRESGDSDEQAAALVRDAWSANEHVPAILAGAKPPVISDDGYVTMGGPDEATYYVTECGAAWPSHARGGRLAHKADRHLGAGNGGHVRPCTDHLKRELDRLMQFEWLVRPAPVGARFVGQVPEPELRSYRVLLRSMPAV